MILGPTPTKVMFTGLEWSCWNSLPGVNPMTGDYSSRYYQERSFQFLNLEESYILPHSFAARDLENRDI